MAQYARRRINQSLDALGRGPMHLQTGWVLHPSHAGTTCPGQDMDIMPKTGQSAGQLGYPQ
ncbi:hypothetical protein A7X75_12830 [Stenotrophomonas maltophilia]|nr:hypothetical protein A7X75_12830 [Stenotrophomonas maltophilia]